MHVLRHLPRQLPRRGRRRADAVECLGGANQIAGARRRRSAGGRSVRAGGKGVPRRTRGGRRAGSGRNGCSKRHVAPLPRCSGRQQTVRMVSRPFRRARAESVPWTDGRDTRRRGTVAPLVNGASSVRARAGVCVQPHARVPRPAVPILVRACGAISRITDSGAGRDPGRILARSARRLRHRADIGSYQSTGRPCRPGAGLLGRRPRRGVFDTRTPDDDSRSSARDLCGPAARHRRLARGHHHRSPDDPRWRPDVHVLLDFSLAEVAQRLQRLLSAVVRSAGRGHARIPGRQLTPGPARPRRPLRGDSWRTAAT